MKGVANQVLKVYFTKTSLKLQFSELLTDWLLSVKYTTAKKSRKGDEGHGDGKLASPVAVEPLLPKSCKFI